MKVYHFVNRQFGLENIRLRRLKIARLNELNDPFEFLSANLGDGDLRWALQAVRDRLAKTKGLMCFSRSWQNPVQWSHYADSHKGICLGFEATEASLCPVAYVKQRTQLDMDRMRRDKPYALDFVSKMLWTKFEHWSYEQEVRLFVSLDPSAELNGLYFYDFSSELKLTDIVVGARSTVERAEINEALGDLSATVRCRKARLAFRSFNVVEQRNADLWI